VYGFGACYHVLRATAGPETPKTETAVTEVSAQDGLDAAIRNASDYINKNIPQGSKLVILNVKSEYAPLSEYIIDVLTGNVVNDRVFTVVDRANLGVCCASRIKWYKYS
jgi:hypothetical protein